MIKILHEVIDLSKANSTTSNGEFQAGNQNKANYWQANDKGKDSVFSKAFEMLKEQASSVKGLDLIEDTIRNSTNKYGFTSRENKLLDWIDGLNEAGGFTITSGVANNIDTIVNVLTDSNINTHKQWINLQNLYNNNKDEVQYLMNIFDTVTTPQKLSKYFDDANFDWKLLTDKRAGKASLPADIDGKSAASNTVWKQIERLSDTFGNDKDTEQSDEEDSYTSRKNNRNTKTSNKFTSTLKSMLSKRSGLSDKDIDNIMNIVRDANNYATQN